MKRWWAFFYEEILREISGLVLDKFYEIEKVFFYPTHDVTLSKHNINRVAKKQASRNWKVALAQLWKCNHHTARARRQQEIRKLYYMTVQ